MVVVDVRVQERRSPVWAVDGDGGRVVVFDGVVCVAARDGEVCGGVWWQDARDGVGEAVSQRDGC